MNITIREMTISDYSSICKIWSSIPGLKLEKADSREGIEKYLKRNPRLSYVACDDEQVIGTVLCGEDGRRGYLQHLCIVEEYRNIGIGNQLLDAAMQSFKLLGLHEIRIFVFKDNEIGNNYWKSKGWLVRDDIYVRAYDLDDLK